MDPLSITFRDIDHSDAVEAYVRQRSAKLALFSDRITSCRVTLAMPHQHQHSDRSFRVSIELTLAGGAVFVNRARPEDPLNHDLYSAIDHAFDQAGRQLEDYVRRQRGDVRTHESEYQEGRVKKLWTYEGYGFLETDEGNEVYFHKNSVLYHGFGRLTVGSKVRFIEEMGDNGPQASTLIPIR